MMKKFFVLSSVLLLFSVAQAQSVESKKCKTCGKPLKECQYRGKHPEIPPQKQKTGSKSNLKDYVRMDGNDIVFRINGKVFTYRMIHVVGSTFYMGVQSNDPNGINYCKYAKGEDGPVHSVTVGNYYIGETEVTNALWKVVMGDFPEEYTWATDDDCPVRYVSWNDAVSFVNKLSTLTGRSFRLPTEEEWEFAERGGVYSQGYMFSGSDNVDEVAWYSENSNDKPHGVGKKKPNELGLFDMSGNVSEWCQSCYINYSNGSIDCSVRMLRGGEFQQYEGLQSIGHHQGFCVPTNSNGMMTWGLRLAMSIDK